MLGSSLAIASTRRPFTTLRGRFDRAHREGRWSAAVVIALIVASSVHASGAEHTEHPPRAVAIADEGGPRELVEASVVRVLSIVRSEPYGAQLAPEHRAEIRRIAEQLFDFDEMARRTLAQHWKDQSPDEQAEFVRLFVNVVERSYLTAIGSHPVSAVTFDGESITGAYAQVRSRIMTRRQMPIPIEYRLLHVGDRWHVYDVVADGVSVVSSYRSQFNTIIRTSSFAQLLETLRGRQADAAPREGH